MLDTLIGFFASLLARCRSPRGEMRADVAAVIGHSDTVMAEWERIAGQLRVDAEALREECERQRVRVLALEDAIIDLREKQQECERGRARDVIRIAALEQNVIDMRDALGPNWVA